MSRFSGVLVALLLAGGAGACAPRIAGRGGSAQPVAAGVAVHVENDYMATMDVFMVSDGVSTRLGAVEPGMSDTFPVSEGLIPNGLVNVVAQPIGGGRTVQTGTYQLRPGNVLDFTIGMDSSGNSVMVH